MPSPVAHSLVGYLVARGTARGVSFRDGALVAYAAFVANAPDLDYLPGLLVGHPTAYHRGWTHSLGAALIAGLAGALVLRGRVGRFAPLFILTAALWASHVLLDAITPDTRGVAGVPLFWPVNSDYVSAPLPWFRGLAGRMGLHLGDTVQGFFAALFSLAALRVFVTELLLFGPFVAIVLLVSPRSRQGKMPRSR